MTFSRSAVATAIAVLSSGIFTTTEAGADPTPPAPRPAVLTSMDEDGVGVSIAATTPGKAPGAASGVTARQPASSAPRYEYRSVVACMGNTPDGDRDTLCQSATVACTSRGQTGPLMRTYRRPAADTTHPWTYTGDTCQPDQIPTDTPAALRAAAETAFARTPLANPQGHVQPPGGVTLVNLPTYTYLTWPATSQGSYGPGQTRTLALLDHTVQLRIRAAHYTYDFGDGTRHGPTTSAGGPYPTGDITHTYERIGRYAPTATATLTADYRVDGGPWQPITGHATRTTALGPLEARALHPVLIPNQPLT